MDPIDRETVGGHGGSRKVSIGNLDGSDKPIGNTAQYAIRRLRKDRPDLHAEVIAGAKSPHAAMGTKVPTVPGRAQGVDRGVRPAADRQRTRR